MKNENLKITLPPRPTPTGETVELSDHNISTIVDALQFRREGFKLDLQNPGSLFAREHRTLENILDMERTLTAAIEQIDLVLGKLS